MQSKFCLTCKKEFFKTPNLSQTFWELSRKYCSNRCKVLGKPSANKGKSFPHLWKEKITYGRLHKWLFEELGKPSICWNCGITEGKKFEWANISGEYKRDLTDWERLCTKCHRKKDLTGKIPWNKGKKGLQVAWNKGKPRTWVTGGDFKKGHTPWNKKVVLENDRQKVI